MGGIGFWRQIGAVGLAFLPLAAVACLIAAMARDSSEIAGAAAAVGAVLSLIVCVQLALLNRETQRVGEGHAELRAQALALARCMRVLNARTIHTEIGEVAEAATPVPAAVASPPSLPSNAAKAQSAPIAPVMSLPGLERWGGILQPPAAPRQNRTPWVSTRSEDVTFRDAVFSILDASGGSAGNFLAVAPASLSRLPLALAAMLSACRADHELGRRLLLGVPQSALRDPDEARIVAELARAGLRMALVGVEDFRLDPEALAACGFACIETSADRLLAAAGMSPRAALGLALLSRRLADRDVVLVCTKVDLPGQVARLSALGVSAAAGTCLKPEAEIVTVPWRATPTAAPQGRLAAFLRRAG